MGLYLNPNAAYFEEVSGSEIYVDKTMLIAKLNALLGTSEKFVCVSRPRRFGKTIAGAMISAYYSKGSNSRSLFSRFKIASDSSFEKNLNAFNVIHIDVNAFYNSIQDRTKIIECISRAVNKELCSAFPEANIGQDEGLANAILQVYGATGERFVLIVDEYDVLVREKVEQQTFEEYLRFLNSLFKNSTLKPAIALGYLTGILPIVRDKIQSKLNEFTEYSMLDARDFSEFVGFSESEVKELCEKYGMDFFECQRWYNGYLMEDGSKIYSPKSVVTAMKKRKFGDYWTQTSSYEALKTYILMNFEGIKDDVVFMLGGGRVGVNVLKYVNTVSDFHSKDDVFTYLIHLGYLAYDENARQCFIPNDEVRTEWVNCIEDEADYGSVMELINESRELLKRTIAKDSDYVAKAIATAHSRATNPLTYNNEASFQSAIGLAYFYATADYTILKELPTGEGYADVVFIPRVFDELHPALIIELKIHSAPDVALNQIKNKRYAEALSNYKKNLLLVGISYSKDTKKHECKIERYIGE